MQLLVVGAGEMGRWFADSVEADAVAFTDVDPAAAEAAAASYDGEAAAVPLDDTDEVDVVCVAVPISATPDAIADHADRAVSAVIDVSGEMRDATAALRAAAPDRELASFHPLFAAANAPGNVPVAVVEPGPTIETIKRALTDHGNTVFETTPEEHDRAMATVQARAHVAVLAYALAAEDVPAEFHTPVSAALEDLVEQVTDNTPEVYTEIQLRFDGAQDVAEAARSLAIADRDAFAALYREASDRDD